MKTKLILLAVVLIACHPGRAADAEKPVRRPGVPAAPAAAAGAVPAAMVAALERILTDEQRAKMRESMGANPEKLRENRDQLAAARRELNEAVLGGKADEKFIQEKTDLIGKLEAEQLRVRMIALSKVAATLTPDQQEKLKQMREQIRTRMARPGTGAGDVAPVKQEDAAPPPPAK